MSNQKAPQKDPAGALGWMGLVEVDHFGVPRKAFWDRTPAGFFELVGRILAVNGRIEYLRGRLDHLPSSGTRCDRPLFVGLRRKHG